LTLDAQGDVRARSLNAEFPVFPGNGNSFEPHTRNEPRVWQLWCCDSSCSEEKNQNIGENPIAKAQKRGKWRSCSIALRGAHDQWNRVKVCPLRIQVLNGVFVRVAKFQKTQNRASNVLSHATDAVFYRVAIPLSASQRH